MTPKASRIDACGPRSPHARSQEPPYAAYLVLRPLHAPAARLHDRGLRDRPALAVRRGWRAIRSPCSGSTPTLPFFATALSPRGSRAAAAGAAIAPRRARLRRLSDRDPGRGDRRDLPVVPRERRDPRRARPPLAGTHATSCRKSARVFGGGTDGDTQLSRHPPGPTPRRASASAVRRRPPAALGPAATSSVSSWSSGGSRHLRSRRQASEDHARQQAWRDRIAGNDVRLDPLRGHLGESGVGENRRQVGSDHRIGARRKDART